MERFRKTTVRRDLTRGPGRVAQALDIDRRFDGIDLCAPGRLWLGTAVRKTGKIGVSVRIGITRDAERPLRFFEIGNPNVSGPRALNAQDAAPRAGI
jgi:DNA-3-methyladenine glycosylase